MKIKSKHKLIFALLVSLLMTGEFAVGKEQLQTPDIELRDISVVNLNFERAKVLLDLKVHNPNQVDIVVESIHYRLKLNNANVNQGHIQQKERFVAQTARAVKVPVTLAYDQHLSNIINALNSSAGQIYEIEGNVKLQGYPELLPFHHKDTLNLCPGC